MIWDFEKAFDSLSWAFIQKTLKNFNFGPNLIKWISLFQQNSNSRIILNGHLSKPFQLQRGCRQGDPISPYLFILCSEYLTQAFNNDPEIEGIKLYKKEHKLSQYADDTSAFLKASEKNLRRSLEIMNWFYYQSGLKINISKTKVIRIGKIRETDRRYCKENNLDWVTNFTALGINYDVLQLDNITNINIEDKRKSMEKILHSWSCRNITPIGKVAILKSLVLSKITHLLQALPSPDNQTLKNIDKMCTDFIWGKKRHEVSKQTLNKDIKDGGLKMIPMSEFDKSLKITWLRKMIQGTPDWLEFAEAYKIERLVYTGYTYHDAMLRNISNPFWRSVTLAYKEWYLTLRKNVNTHPADEPIWGNPEINIPFNANWFNKRIITIADMYNEQGVPLSITKFQENIGMKTMFTQFIAFWKALPTQYKDQMTINKKNFDVKMPITIEWILRDKKGGAQLRKVWTTENSKTPPIGQTKWMAELQNEENLNWSYLYSLPFKCRINARTKYFQYQILHRTLITNKKLHQFGLVPSDKCNFCGELETISHLLYECPEVKNLWEQMIKWIKNSTRDKTLNDKVSILLGNNDNKLITNLIILITKHTIYKRKWMEKRPTIIELKHIIKKHMLTELYIGTITDNEKKVLGKWSPFYRELSIL